ncbi:maleylacetoacetate isomerase [Novosphingobium album (ex Hu et al. 2023)]|uniref:Maleylacetoacetate isomerase n=1 Tax=Novosphingobium album (ex Hu et al. 2023) TaxID=2930093 RepID=A0ABT0B7B1_9SPHN|nr:maleylacetoacetate isomerase [Novosphingobium album (ex Hu et al. 2023)]MCJ2180966.1 maleylacetoacetate isomerase [Novosphingobium album (ex Hu et al. 2023)]
MRKAASMSLVLHGYWRPSAAYRVRIALNLKGLEYRQVTHDLRTGSQRNPEYRGLAPIGLVPALETDDGQVLTQSLAIFEWLEEQHPYPPLLPDNASERAAVRAMACIVACDIHPINNLRVLKALREELVAGEDMVRDWIARWINEGFTALETMVSHHGGHFCFGDTPTLADCCLVPQIYNARRFEVALSAYPRLLGIEANCEALHAFANAAPEVQPDADGPAT